MVTLLPMNNLLSSMPALFVPHGAPTFILEPGAAGAALVEAAHRLAKPKAILIVSAHWHTEVPTLSIASRPDTIHDFYGFPQELYSIRYPASGAVSWAMEARSLLEEAGFEVKLDPTRGLDHGAWVPLKLMYPEADIPVFTLSLQSHLGTGHHYRLGQALALLREQGVLVIGSGNLTHNLAHFRRTANAIPEYVTAFQAWVKNKLEVKDVAALLDYRHLAPDALVAHPTEEHWLPFYVALGAAGAEFNSEVLYSGIQHNMLAMDSFAFSSETGLLN
jgi:4,5-DOPA dioxygenase extradiol